MSEDSTVVENADAYSGPPSNNKISDLIDLSRERSSAGRVVLAATLSELFNERNSGLSDSERSLMFDIMRRMVHECEICVRKTLAMYLAASKDAPADLIATLANDEIDVAYPVLTESGVLKDMDLIEVVRNCTFQHQLAVAVRDGLSADVSSALVETGNEDVARALLENGTAEIRPETMETLAERSKAETSLQEPILRRADVSPELAKRMFMWVSVALRCHIIEHFDVSQVDLDQLMERAALEELEKVQGDLRLGNSLAGGLAEEEIDGATAPELMVQALQAGDVPLFISLFRKVSGLRKNLIMRLMIEPGGEGLAVACKGLGFSRTFFSTLYTLSRKATPGQGQGGERNEASALRQALDFFDNTKEAECKKLLQRWHLDSGYLNALRHFETTSCG